MDLKSRIKRSICTSQQQVFLRKEFDRFGSYRQVSRVLRELEGEGHLVRSGYGVYVKPALQAVEDFLGQVQSKLNKRSQRTVTFHSKVIQLGSQQPESSNAQSRLDDVKLRLALELVKLFDLSTIRQKSLENLARWEKNDVWCSAFDEWRQVLQKGSNQQLVAVLTGQDQKANRLRQSSPYTGLLDRSTVERIRETSTA
ncbi:hypothetical protein ACIPLR_17660 [Herbaspirillum huttiense]|jgi:hypothetical protein|uniref:hypothetical protein n=1 Tax=Herbaspirillum huttiense TaxID=863372 RepID=UPI0037FB7A35